MTTPEEHATGVAFALDRLRESTNAIDLRRVWNNLGVTMQRDAEVLALKEKLKRRLK